MTLKISAAATALAMVAAPAFANTTSVSCPGYVISMSDTVAIQGEAQAGGTAAFHRVVCERSSEAANQEDGTVQTYPVFIEALGISTRVVVFKTGGDD